MPDDNATPRNPTDTRAPIHEHIVRPVYLLSFWACFLAATIIYRGRALNLHNVPRTGPLLIVMNHQSNLDPPLAGSLIRRRYLLFIARVGLFKSERFGRLIRAIGAIPIRRGEPDLPAVKAAIKHLHDGGAVVVFAEGSRTPHGELQPFQKGTTLLLKRAKCTVLPVAIEGFRDAWPRGTSRPKLLGQRVIVNCGTPIPPDTLLAMKPDDALRHLGAVIEDLRIEARARLRRATNGTRPNDTAGDHKAQTHLWYTAPEHMPEELSDAPTQAPPPDRAPATAAD